MGPLPCRGLSRCAVCHRQHAAVPARPCSELAVPPPAPAAPPRPCRAPPLPATCSRGGTASAPAQPDSFPAGCVPMSPGSPGPLGVLQQLPGLAHITSRLLQDGVHAGQAVHPCLDLLSQAVDLGRRGGERQLQHPAGHHLDALGVGSLLCGWEPSVLPLTAPRDRGDGWTEGWWRSGVSHREGMWGRAWDQGMAIGGMGWSG